MSDQPTKDQIIAKADTIFAKYDKNHNGKLNPLEFKDALKEVFVELKVPGQKHSGFLAELKLADKDGDKQLDKKEFQNLLLGFFKL